MCKVKNDKGDSRERGAKRMSSSVMKMIIVEWNWFLRVKFLSELDGQTDFCVYELLFLSGKTFMVWRMPSFSFLEWQRLEVFVSLASVWPGRSE